MDKIIEVRNLIKRYKKADKNAVDVLFLTLGTYLFVKNERNR